VVLTAGSRARGRMKWETIINRQRLQHGSVLYADISNLVMLAVFVLMLLPGSAMAAAPQSPRVSLPATAHGQPVIATMLRAPGSTPCHVKLD
jgi:hypothetical protein